MLCWEYRMAVIQDLSLTLKAKLFRGLGDPSRLAILEALRVEEKTVSELVDATGLSQPNASAHLTCLRDCGLVVSRQEGRYVFYAVADARMEEVFRAVEGILADVAAEVYACTRQDRLGGTDATT
jgi:DNA-binding transcriptional ArsR family regulator